MKHRNICTFVFGNGSEVHVAVDLIGADAEYKPFMTILEEAKDIGFRGDEERGRGGIREFKIGSLIACPV